MTAQHRSLSQNRGPYDLTEGTPNFEKHGGLATVVLHNCLRTSRKALATAAAKLADARPTDGLARKWL